MKWFLGICTLGGLVGMIAVSSCGPTKPFCPSTPDFSCYDQDGNVIGGAGGGIPDPCDGKAPIICNGMPFCGTACP